MINVSITIERPVDIVWDYFTTPGNWSKWYGGGLKKVIPRWQNGATLAWELGGGSIIESFVTKEHIIISGSVMDTTYAFKEIGPESTLVDIQLSDPKPGMVFTDGGLVFTLLPPGPRHVLIIASKQSGTSNFKDVLTGLLCSLI